MVPFYYTYIYGKRESCEGAELVCVFYYWSIFGDSFLDSLQKNS
jgi:hypothetical protein